MSEENIVRRTKVGLAQFGLKNHWSDVLGNGVHTWLLSAKEGSVYCAVTLRQ